MNQLYEKSNPEFKKRIDWIEKCGANRGPHDYIPIQWKIKDEFKQVTILLCRNCMHRVSTETLVKYYPSLDF